MRTELPLKNPKAMLSGTAIALALFAQSVLAQASQTGLKDIYANYFRIGTCFHSAQTSNAELRNVILREFNSVTHENGLKPDATMVRNGSTNTDIKVQFNTEATNVLSFCQTNNIPLRGHTLVWHSQTPQWFFFSDMANGSTSSLASKAVMLQRMESYIKNMFALIKDKYPNLKLYAYDVVNEIFEDNGQPRAGGFGSGQSPWVQIFGDNSFADSAFVYARKYAPTGCKLFYNDYNEYQNKRTAMVAMATRLKNRGVLDGLGMQSHLSTTFPSISAYKTALNAFIAAGVEINVTELDITMSNSTEAAQANAYRDIFQALKDAKAAGANITSVSVWGVRDDWSWRKDGTPLLFNSSYGKKPAYNSVSALVPQSEWGDGNNPGGVTSIGGKNVVRNRTAPLVTIRGRTLNVNSSTDSKVNIRIVNMTGKTVANFNASGNAKLALKKISAGAYIVEARRMNDGYRITSSVVLR